jgi:nicotinate-nucleotide--dimethylbenzimidazole phosphoribosyltransferase
MFSDAVAAIDYPDADAAHAARLRHVELAKPAGSLGKLEELSIWAAGVQGNCPPPGFEAVRAVLFGADHGIAVAGVSAYPVEVTAQLARLINDGRAPVNAVAGDAAIRVVDVAIDADTSSPFKVRRGSGRIDTEDALTPQQVSDAIQAGIELADEEIGSGAQLLVAGSFGVGSSTPAAALVAVLTDTEPVKVIGRASGIDDDAWIRKCGAVRDARRRAWPHRNDPEALLQVAGGADLAALTGFLIQAAARKVPVVLDGLVPCTAALVAQLASPRVVRWLCAGQLAADPGHDLALRRLGLSPVLSLGVELDQGVGALLAVPVLRSATRLLRDTASYVEAGVSQPITASVAT